MVIGIPIVIDKGEGSILISYNHHPKRLLPLNLFEGHKLITEGLKMMTKRVWAFLNTKEKGRDTIGQQTKILKRYKNGNYKIAGQRSITSGNWKRKRTMLLHHREVREYKEFYEFKGTYLEAMKEKGEELKTGEGMWIESIPKSP